MNSIKVKVLVVLAFVVLASYWYWSPLLTLHQLRTAAKAGDADSFNDHVDYPRLREGLKGQLSAAFMKHLSSQPEPENGFAKAGAALGTVLGMAMVDKMVDAFVRPEVVMQAMQEGKMAPTKAPETAPSSGAPGGGETKFQSERKGADKYIVHVSTANELEDQRVSLVLERSGFATWKLTEVRLPALQ